MAAAVIGLGVAAVLVVHRRRPELLAPVLVGTALALVLSVTLLPTHPSAGSSGAQWQPIPTQGGLGTALRHLADGSLDAAVQVLVLLGAVYALLGAALATARPGQARWLLVAPTLAVAVELVQYRWLGRVGSLDDVLVATAAAAVGWRVVTSLARTRARH